MKIGIVGAGKIGSTIATLLDASDFCTEVVIGDSRAVRLPRMRKVRFVRFDVNRASSLRAFIRGLDAVVSAAPFFLNKGIASACAASGVSYFDLTEDVDTTAFIRKLARKSDATFMPQCGLAPGAINIIGAGMAAQLKEVRQLEMRVGALPLTASNQMKYYLSWSTAGLINEYCHPCDALYQGRHMKTLPLEGVERITIDGTEYEAFNTSGGVATMCETYAGRVQDLTYKTLRYPGHRDMMKFVLQDLNLASRPGLMTEIFDQEVPLTDNDVVVFYVSAVGTHSGQVKQRSFVKKIRGATVNKVPLSAIQLTTAAGLLAVIELFAAGRLKKGFVKQESVSMADFLSTRWGGQVYGGAG
jgi:saccharopine dehydrogenase-like NADP-dependent oxidoreductase